MFTFSNFKQYFKQLNLIYTIYLIFYLLTMTFVYAMNMQHQFELEDKQLNKFYLDFLIGILLFLLSGYIKKALSKKALSTFGLFSKLKLFSIYYLVNLSIIVIYGLVNSLLFWQSGNLLLLFFAAYALLLMLLMKPKPEKMSYLLHLDADEQYFILHPERSFN